MPDACKVLTGPAYAPLRPEFAACRAHILVERPSRTLENILVSMGGADLPDATSQVLALLAGLALPASSKIVVVMGQAAPALHKVRDLAASMANSCDVVADVNNIQDLMARADLAVGAVGGTAWERCALGLPSLLVTIAENQKPGARALHGIGAGVLLGDVSDPDWTQNLKRSLESLSNPEALARLSEASSAVCDGDGALRIAAHLLAGALRSRAAEINDARRIWEWRREGGANRYYKSARDVSYPEHYRWFARALDNPHIKFAVLIRSQLPVGYVRLDHLDAERACVSICLGGDHRGQGLAGPALGIAHDLAKSAGYRELLAEIHPDNVASLRLFKAAGYNELPTETEFKAYLLALGERSK